MGTPAEEIKATPVVEPVPGTIPELPQAPEPTPVSALPVNPEPTQQ